MNDLEPTDDLVIDRTFDAPIDVVWSMWTTPEHFRSWYGPAGATVPVAELDVVVGGRRRVAMAVEGPEGPIQMWFVGEHLEVDPPTRLVYTESMADEAGRPLDRGGPATRVEVRLTELGAQTRMVMTHHGVPAGSPGATGWTMAFEKLAALLPT